jgi:hypothetical protein
LFVVSVGVAVPKGSKEGSKVGLVLFLVGAVEVVVVDVVVEEGVFEDEEDRDSKGSEVTRVKLEGFGVVVFVVVVVLELKDKKGSSELDVLVATGTVVEVDVVVVVFGLKPIKNESRGLLLLLVVVVVVVEEEEGAGRPKGFVVERTGVEVEVIGLGKPKGLDVERTLVVVGML